MNLGIENLATNLYMNIEFIILIVVVCGNLIFYAKDFKLGLLISFITFGLCFMWFYNNGWNYTAPLVLMFIAVAGLALSLFAVAKDRTAGGLI